METACSLLLLFSAPFLCVCGTPVYLSSLSPTQDSDLVTTAASTLNIDSGLGQTGPDGVVEDRRWNGKKEVKKVRQIPNTEAVDGEDASLASTTETESQKIGEDDSSESWLSPLDEDDVPKQFLSPEMATEGATMTTMQDPLMLPALGPLPKEDGPESLWTEAARPSGADTLGPLSQDDATESTMSSESLPLIFDPLEDDALSDRTRPNSVTMETDSEAPPPLLPDWTSPGQTSGTELLEPIRTSDSSVEAGSEAGADQDWTGAVRTSNPEENTQSAGPSLSSLQRPTTTVTMTTATMTTATVTTQYQQHRQHRQHHPESGPGFYETHCDWDLDEDEENSEESVEESEEDLTEAPDASTPPPYSLIPPPPVWVQRNQGLMRSWVELIREKAGYVSGMLAPVGIGISGALLLVGAAYSIRTIHRKRRNSFKHQRRKSRQPEQPREPCVSGQDQAMLLADSSEDEF